MLGMGLKMRLTLCMPTHVIIFNLHAPTSFQVAGQAKAQYSHEGGKTMQCEPSYSHLAVVNDNRGFFWCATKLEVTEECNTTLF